MQISTLDPPSALNLPKVDANVWRSKRARASTHHARWRSTLAEIEGTGEDGGGVIHSVDQVRVSDESPRVDFDDIYRHNFEQLVRLANLLTASNSASEDIVQEAFVQLHKRLSTVENPAAYLRITVVNLCKNLHRSQSREARRMARVEAQPASVPSDVGEVLAIVDRLPFRQRTALVARYWLDLPEAAIAELIGCRPGTVKSLTSRALSTLRKDLQ